MPIEHVFERFPKLRELGDRRGRFLSGGEQQMLAIARALVTGPDLILLDEPSQGLAPLVVETVVGTIADLKRERVSMLLVEQNVELACGLADRVYVIDQGRIVFEGTPAALRADPRTLGTYLGVGGQPIRSGPRRPPPTPPPPRAAAKPPLGVEHFSVGGLSPPYVSLTQTASWRRRVI